MRPVHAVQLSDPGRAPLDGPAPPPAPDAATLAAVRAALAAQAGQPGALLPVLHALQDVLGWVPDSAVPPIAQALNLSRAEVHGVLSYYHHFRRRPPARHVLQLCAAEACLACAGAALVAEAERLTGCRLGQTRADGAVALEAVYCLGLCASAPAALVDGQPRARLDAAALARTVAALDLHADGARDRAVDGTGEGSGGAARPTDPPEAA